MQMTFGLNSTRHPGHCDLFTFDTIRILITIILMYCHNNKYHNYNNILDNISKISIVFIKRLDISYNYKRFVGGL